MKSRSRSHAATNRQTHDHTKAQYRTSIMNATMSKPRSPLDDAVLAVQRRRFYLFSDVQVSDSSQEHVDSVVHQSGFRLKAQAKQVQEEVFSQLP
jgi:hypothetical protein